MKKTILLPTVALVGSMAFIFLYILSYENCWYQPEKLKIVGSLLLKPSQGFLSDLLRAFDSDTFEFAARTTRPLSELFDILDLKITSYLWNFILPHPGLSITYFFTLFLTPFFLYKIAAHYTYNFAERLWTLVFYFTSIGTLSLLSMNFRSGKPIACSAILGLIIYT
jgi:hypothetical protein